MRFRRATVLPFALAFLFITAHRLPAPITEETTPTPVPKPKPEATSKPKPKPEATSKPKATAALSFAGTWAGTANYTQSNGGSGTASYLIKISDDEKTVLVNVVEVGKVMSGPPAPFSCTRFREALTWSDSKPAGTTTYTMRINSNGTASLRREGTYTVARVDVWGDPTVPDTVTYTVTGTLSRQDISGTSSISQTAPDSPPQKTATPAASKNIGGLPVAKPVPDKPGFVYNPFDPSSRVLLDVRGKTSGTKLIEPKSGKLFVVP